VEANFVHAVAPSSKADDAAAGELKQISIKMEQYLDLFNSFETIYQLRR
jgi:hypothetical protein